MSSLSRIALVVLAAAAALLGVAKLVGIVLVATSEPGRDLAWIVKQVAYSGLFIAGAFWCWTKSRSHSGPEA